LNHTPQAAFSSVHTAEYMSNLENVLINPSNKPSYVLCSQGSSNLKWLVRGRGLVLVVVTELCGAYGREESDVRNASDAPWVF
jgi:hypothetical protein